MTDNDLRITKEDLESKFQSLQDDLQGRASLVDVVAASVVVL